MTETPTDAPDANSRLQRILTDHDVYAFVAMDSVGPLAQRIRAILDTGRPMTVIRRWFNSDGLEVRAGLHVNDNPEARTPIQVWTSSRGDSTGFTVDCAPGIESFGFSANTREDPTEAVVARRYRHPDPRISRHSLTRVDIHGWPTGRDVSVTIEHWNDDRVGYQTTIAWAPLPSARTIAEDQAAVLDVLADARSTWTATSLRITAQRARDHWQPVSEVLAGACVEAGPTANSN